MRNEDILNYSNYKFDFILLPLICKMNDKKKVNIQFMQNLSRNIYLQK